MTKNKGTQLSLIMLSIILFLSIIFSQEVLNVKKIKENFDDYKDETVIIEGFITQYIEDITKTTSFYFLKDDWGGIIKVRTSKALPKVGKKFRVTGVVDKDISTQDIFLSEEMRSLIPTPPSPEEELKGEGTWLAQNWPYLVGGVGGLILVLLIIVLVYALKERRSLTSEISVTPLPKSEIEKGEIPEPEEVLEGETVKIAVPPPGTLKILPGKFVVLEGDEKIKEIRFFKEKSSLETEITFGRAAGPNYSHIQFKPMSVSAKHAKLIYAGNKFTLINYSNTNPTRVNGIDLPENGSIELDEGDKIEMGEMVFEFKKT